MSNYSELLKDPRWQKKRLEVFNRDNWTCQCCLDTDSTLHVHHTKYTGKFPWDCPDKYLITLCEQCHQKEEELKQQDLYEPFEDLGITRSQLVILIDHVRFRLLHPLSDEDARYRPFWRFHYEILRELVRDEELGTYNKFVASGKNKVKGSSKINNEVTNG